MNRTATLLAAALLTTPLALGAQTAAPSSDTTGPGAGQQGPMRLAHADRSAGHERWQRGGGHRQGRGEGTRGADMRGGPDGRRGMEHRLAGLIETYDSDGDGSVTQAEIDTARAARLAAFDADGNGTLNIAEYEALWLDAMRERMVDRFQAHDDDGDGEVTVEEFGEDQSRMVRRMDRNDDGALSQDDMGPRRRQDR